MGNRLAIAIHHPRASVGLQASLGTKIAQIDGHCIVGCRFNSAEAGVGRDAGIAKHAIIRVATATEFRVDAGFRVSIHIGHRLPERADRYVDFIRQGLQRICAKDIVVPVIGGDQPVGHEHAWHKSAGGIVAAKGRV